MHTLMKKSTIFFIFIMPIYTYSLPRIDTQIDTKKINDYFINSEVKIIGDELSQVSNYGDDFSRSPNNNSPYIYHKLLLEAINKDPDSKWLNVSLEDFAIENSPCLTKMADCIALVTMRKKNNLYPIANKLANDQFNLTFNKLSDAQRKTIVQLLKAKAKSEDVMKAFKNALDDVRGLSKTDLTARLIKIRNSNTNFEFFKYEKQKITQRDTDLTVENEYLIQPNKFSKKGVEESKLYAAYGRVKYKDALWFYDRIFLLEISDEVKSMLKERIENELSTLKIDTLKKFLIEPDPHINRFIFHELELIKAELEQGSGSNDVSDNVPSNNHNRYNKKLLNAINDDPDKDWINASLEDFEIEDSPCLTKMADCIALTIMKKKNSLYPIANEISNNQFGLEFNQLNDEQRKTIVQILKERANDEDENIMKVFKNVLDEVRGFDSTELKNRLRNIRDSNTGFEFFKYEKLNITQRDTDWIVDEKYLIKPSAFINNDRDGILHAAYGRVKYKDTLWFYEKIFHREINDEDKLIFKKKIQQELVPAAVTEDILQKSQIDPYPRVSKFIQEELFDISLEEMMNEEPGESVTEDSDYDIVKEFNKKIGDKLQNADIYSFTVNDFGCLAQLFDCAALTNYRRNQDLYTEAEILSETHFNDKSYSQLEDNEKDWVIDKILESQNSERLQLIFDTHIASTKNMSDSDIKNYIYNLTKQQYSQFIDEKKRFNIYSPEYKSLPYNNLPFDYVEHKLDDFIDKGENKFEFLAYAKVKTKIMIWSFNEAVGSYPDQKFLDDARMVLTEHLNSITIEELENKYVDQDPHIKLFYNVELEEIQSEWTKEPPTKRPCL